MSNQATVEKTVVAGTANSRFVQIGNKKHELQGLPETDASVLNSLVADKDYEGEGENGIEKALERLQVQMTIYPIPDFSIYSTFRYKDKEKTQLKEVSFLLKGLAAYRFLLPTKYTFTVQVNKDFYRNVMSNLVTYFNNYAEFRAATKNAKALTAKVAHVAESNGVKLPHTIQFVVGEGYPVVTNTEIHIGVSADVLATLNTSVLFAEGDDLQSQNAESIILSYVSNLTDYDAYSATNRFTEILGLRKQGVGASIRDNLSRRLAVGIASNLVGTFYAVGNVTIQEEGKDVDYRTIALVERRSISPEAVETMKADPIYAPFFENGAYVVEENTAPKKSLASKGETLIISYLTLNPIPYNRVPRYTDKEALYSTCTALKLADVIALEKEQYGR